MKSFELSELDELEILIILKTKTMEYEKMSVELFEEGKVIRIDDAKSRKSVYLEVKSINF